MHSCREICLDVGGNMTSSRDIMIPKSHVSSEKCCKVAIIQIMRHIHLNVYLAGTGAVLWYLSASVRYPWRMWVLQPHSLVDPVIYPHQTKHDTFVLIFYRIYITMTSQWARCHLKSPASRMFAQPFVQAQIKEKIKTLCHWPIWGESTGDRWIHLTKG